MPTFFGRPRRHFAGAAITQGKRGQPAGLSVGARMGVELVVATCLGGGLGFLADRKLGSQPWLTLVGVLMGTAAGIRNVLRLAGELDRPGGPGADHGRRGDGDPAGGDEGNDGER